MDTTYPPLFISYRSTDRALAQDLYGRLTAAGFDVWFDVTELDRAVSWFAVIEEACAHARVILPVLTPRWLSRWTEYETYPGECVVPLVCEGEGPLDALVPAPIAEWQALDLRGATEETWETLFRRLRGTLEQLPPRPHPRVRALPIGPNRHFVGRDEELAHLHEQLCTSPVAVLTHSPAVAVEGFGGVGKTTLAREYAERFWRLYHDLLWVSAADPSLLPLEFARVAEDLGVAEGDDAGANARRALMELTHGPRRQLIVDNANDEQSLQGWLPTSGKCRTIITTRFTHWSAEVATMGVRVLAPDPARELLLSRSGLPDTAANRAMADKLAEELGYLPLALEQAGSYIRQQHTNLEHYLEQYRAHRQALLACRPPGHYPDSVATTWQISVAQLDQAALELLRTLAFVAPAPLPRIVLRISGDLLGGLDELGVDQALAELRRYSLIELQDNDGPLTIHRLLQAVQEDGLEVGERQPWVERALRVIERPFPQADYSNWQVCEALLPHALACCAHAQQYEVLTREAGLLPGLVGVFFQQRGQMSASQAPLEQAVRAYRRLVDSQPGNAEWQRELAVSHDRIGDVRVAQGDLSGALEAYQDSLDIAQRLAAADPGNAEWQRDLSVSHNKIGDVREGQGDLTGALVAYEAALSIRQRLADADPGNAAWQRDLSVSHNKIGDVREGQGDLTGALAAYEAALSIRQRLAAADPGKAEWQRDLSVSHSRIGDVRRAQGDLTGAIGAYEADLRIAEHLADADPDNAEWQRDLAISHTKIGDVRRAQGDLTGALAAYEAALRTAEHLADADAGNAQWQRDLAASLQRLAVVHGEAKQPEQAWARVLQCREVLRGMRDRGMHLDPPAAELLEQLEELP